MPPSAVRRTSSSDSTDSIRKRVGKACDRCRLKKSKCDGSHPCTRCKADNAICVFGERKKSHDKIYPKGYVEMLEQQQAQLVAGLQETYRRLVDANVWPGKPLSEASGQPLTHDILARLDLLEPKNDGSGEHEHFEEDCQKLQQRLISEGASFIARRSSISSESEHSLPRKHARTSSHSSVHSTPIPAHSAPVFDEKFTFHQSASPSPVSQSTTMFSAARQTALRQARSSCLRPRVTSPLSRDVALARLLSTLAVLEQREGKLNMSSLAAVSAAMKLGGSITGFVAGSNVKAVAEEAAKVEGLEKVIYVDNASYDKGLPENFAPLLVENIKKGGFTHVFAGHSAFGKNLMPRVAALLDVQQISDITNIESEDTFVRPIYAGNAILTVQTDDSPKVVTVRGTAFPSGAAEGGSASVEEGVDPKAECPTEWISEDLATSDRPDLATAEKVVSGGRGLKSKEEFDRIMPPLADALGAAIGASRAAVDSGFADNSLQVGQTGKNVAPQLYLCAGISGAIQHLAGMKDSKVIAAINKDADAPIFQVADVGLVGDLFEKVPELTEKLKQ